MKVLTCGHCGTKIYQNNGDSLYMCCDAHVCSKACQRARLIAIAQTDPRMENPLAWTKHPSGDKNTFTKRTVSMIGLQDLELGDGEKTPLIQPCNSPKIPREGDSADMVTVTFLNMPCQQNEPPNQQLQYMILSCALGLAFILMAA